MQALLAHKASLAILGQLALRESKESKALLGQQGLKANKAFKAPLALLDQPGGLARRGPLVRKVRLALESLIKAQLLRWEICLPLAIWSVMLIP